MRLIFAIFAGTLFGAGLAYSGMADPVRVIGFLDLFGAWDPTLAFVMMGAIVPMAIAWLIQRRMRKPLVESEFSLPTQRKIDAPLAIGALIFGAGWGLTGICPGPGIANLAIVPMAVLPYLIAVAVGMAAHHLFARRTAQK
jgi:uncharacterized membrane protein YedE/YeeE